MDKLSFKGTVISIQPRIRLLRSFDEASHTYLGYAIKLEGEISNSDNTNFSIGIGKAAHSKHQFKVNDVISGECVLVPDPDLEPDLANINSWPKIEELRLLANVIKHGDEWSATKLKKLRPDFFDSGIISTDLLDLYKTTLGEKVLNTDDSEYKIYTEAIIQFWNDLPDVTYSK